MRQFLLLYSILGLPGAIGKEASSVRQFVAIILLAPTDGLKVHDKIFWQ